MRIQREFSWDQAPSNYELSRDRRLREFGRGGQWTRPNGSSAMRRQIAFVILGLLVIGVIAGWSNRAYISAYFDNSIGAPAEDQLSTYREPDDTVMLRLAVAGDVGTGGEAEYQTSAVMDELESQRNYDALLLLGDNIYEDGDPADVDRTVFDPFAPVLDDQTQLFAVLGNHDVREGNGPAQAEALGMPGQWYSTTIGDTTTLIALDSNEAANAQQQDWLRSTLAATTTEWTIVTMHHPAYSAGWHGSDPTVQAMFVPVFEEYQVDLVFSGHDHDYQRSKTINGVTYIVTGAAAKLRPAGSEGFTAVAWSTHSFVDLAIYGDRLEGQAVDHAGRVIDAFTLQKE